MLFLGSWQCVIRYLKKLRLLCCLNLLIPLWEFYIFYMSGNWIVVKLCSWNWSVVINLDYSKLISCTFCSEVFYLQNFATAFFTFLLIGVVLLLIEDPHDLPKWWQFLLAQSTFPPCTASLEQREKQLEHVDFQDEIQLYIPATINKIFSGGTNLSIENKEN